MTHVAFDLGLRTTGVAWDGGSDHHTSPARLHKSPITPELEHERFGWWRDTFGALLFEHLGDVVVEAPIIHRTHARGSIPLILLHGILRGVALNSRRNVHVVSPSELKRFATGKGNATKDEMVTAARGMGWVGDDHNEADAWLVWSWFATAGQVAA